MLYLPSAKTFAYNTHADAVNTETEIKIEIKYNH